MANENENKGTNTAEGTLNQEGTVQTGAEPKKHNFMDVVKTGAKVIAGVLLFGAGWIAKSILSGGSDDDDEPTVSTETTEV